MLWLYNELMVRSAYQHGFGYGVLIFGIKNQDDFCVNTTRLKGYFEKNNGGDKN